MGRVRRSTYRQGMSPKGIEGVEKKTLEHLDSEMFVNFNTGALEQYLDEKNRNSPKSFTAWSWKKVLIAIVIGSAFAMINQYVGLKVGMVIAGAWYVIFLLGLALKWDARSLNIAGSASNGASLICVGFVFTFPAIYILAMDPSEMVKGEFLIDSGDLGPLIPVAITATMISGLLGVMYFIIFRRVWLVEDPLPTPGFEAMVKLLELTKVTTQTAAAQARRSVKQAAFWISGTALFTFFRDFPMFDLQGRFSIANAKIAPIDRVAMALNLQKNYIAGDIIFTPEPAKWTFFSITLLPIQFGLGWFMKAKTAIIISAGTVFTWFVVVPIAVWMRAPFYWANSNEYFDVSSMGLFFGADLGGTNYSGIPVSPALAAFEMARVMAIGAILGGGMTALIKMVPIFSKVFKDMTKLGKEDKSKASYIPGRGWYEWPISHIVISIVATMVLVTAVFMIGGFPFIPSVVFSLLLVLFTFLLGAIAVKVMGETGIEPVSATSFLVLLFLMVTFMIVLPIFGLEMGRSRTIIMALIGTTVFGAAISMSGNLVRDFKNGIYVGNRPHDLVKAITPGMIPGAIISGLAAVILSIGLAEGELNLIAPQAHAVSIFVKGLVANAIQWRLFWVGAGIGVFLELLMGIGTAFGLGMYFPIGFQIPMLVGGVLRSLWEKRYLEPTAKEKGWGEDVKTIKILGTYMMATGLMVGEALMGTLVAVYLVLPLVFNI